jgi:hypothetical protein
MIEVIAMLEGKELVVERLSHQLNLTSDDGTSLAIFNKFTYVSWRGDESGLSTGRNVRVVQADSSDSGVTLRFSGGDSLVIDLSPCAYTGPEAMVLRTPSGQIVVWN